MLLLAYAFGEDRPRIPWRVVASGIAGAQAATCMSGAVAGLLFESGGY